MVSHQYALDAAESSSKVPVNPSRRYCDLLHSTVPACVVNSIVNISVRKVLYQHNMKVIKGQEYIGTGNGSGSKGIFAFYLPQ